MPKIIDLSYDIEEGMATFNASWHPRISVKQLGRIGFEGRETREIILGTHTGTHVDAPLHFLAGAESIENIKLETLIGPVTIFDMTHLGENQAVVVKMLESFDITKRVLFKFGWGRYWGNKKFYQGYPFFSVEATQYLIDKGVELIGIDTPSPDDSRINLSGDVMGSHMDSPIHKMFLGKNIVLVEYVANLDKVIDYNGWNIIVMPIRLKGADGAPARVCLIKE